MKKLFYSIKQKVFEIKLKIMCVAATKCDQVQELVNEVQNTKFTKKIPMRIAMFCSTMLVGLMPTVVFAADSNTSSIDKFVEFVCDWLVKIGAVVMLVGGVMFALGLTVNKASC